jgi:putative flippase GtrA
VLFPLTVAGNFVVTTVGVALLVEVGGVDQRLAPLLAALVAIPVTFVATRYLLLGPRLHIESPP